MWTSPKLGYTISFAHDSFQQFYHIGTQNSVDGNLLYFSGEAFNKDNNSDYDIYIGPRKLDGHDFGRFHVSKHVTFHLR